MAYPGNIPAAVAKDAKYSVVHGTRGQMEIRLIYRLSQGEKALITTSVHPELVQMVNEIKQEYGAGSGGAFYINEYGHVLVPAGSEYYCAGSYGRYLEFDFEGISIGPQAPSSLRPGDFWPGPRVGIPYVLTADGTDIRFSRQTGPSRIREIRLSEEVGRPAATRLARRLGRHKYGGGRVYINEAREFFAPIEADGGWRHIYLGPLGDDEWYKAPSLI